MEKAEAAELLLSGKPVWSRCIACDIPHVRIYSCKTCEGRGWVAWPDLIEAYKVAGLEVPPPPVSPAAEMERQMAQDFDEAEEKGDVHDEDGLHDWIDSLEDD